jgi:trimeric autotransporter adhesin
VRDLRYVPLQLTQQQKDEIAFAQKDFSEMKPGKKIFSTNGELMLSAREAAERLSCAPDYVSKLCREGKLQGVQEQGVWLVEEESLVAFDKARELAKAARARELSEERRQESLKYREANPISWTEKIHKASSYRGVPFMASMVMGLALLGGSATLSKSLDIHSLGGSLAASLAQIHSPFFATGVQTSAPRTGSLSAFFSSLLGGKRTTVAQATFPAASNATTTVVSGAVVQNTYPITERTIERVVTRIESGLTQEVLDRRLQELSNGLIAKIYEMGTQSSNNTVLNIAPPLSRIDQLNGTTLNNVTVHGISGLQASDLPALDYFPATSTIASIYGGTGFSTYTPGDILYADSTGTLTVLPVGSNGRVLKVAGGLPAWGVESGSSGGSGFFSTTTDELAIYPSDTTDVVLIGTSATSTTGNIFEVSGNALFRSALTAYGTATASRFVATSSVASIFPYASSTALTVSGTGYFTTASTTNLTVSGIPSALLKTNSSGVVSAAVLGTDYVNYAYPFPGNATTTALTFSGGITVGSLNGPLQANNGVVSATSSIGVLYGGTGLSSAPAFGQLLLGNASGGYTLTATSSLGLLGSTSITASAPLAWNANTGALSITQSGSATDGYLSSTDWNLFNNKVSSTSLSATYPLAYNSSTGVFTTAFSTTTQNNFNAHNTFTSLFATNASSTFATTTNLALTSVTSSLLKTNSLGQVIAAVLGTDYQNFGYLFPSNATTTQLAFNGGATFAGATSTASFAVTGSTTISSALNVGSTINANGALTVAGDTSLQGATSTSFAISGISSGNLLKTTTGGAIVAAVAGTDYLTSSNISAAFPFTPTTNFGATANSTSTPIWFTAGLQASSTSRLGTTTFSGNVGIGTSSPMARLTLAESPSFGAITASQISRGAYMTYTPSATLQVGATQLRGLDTLLDASSVTLDHLSGGGLTGILYGANFVTQGTPNFNDPGVSEAMNLQSVGVQASVSVDPTYTAGRTITSNTYAGLFSNDSTGLASYQSTAYGIQASSAGNLASTTVSTHYGGSFTVAGTAADNIGLNVNVFNGVRAYGLKIQGVSSANSNYGIYMDVNSVEASSTNYAIYSSAPAQSYIEGNLGIGTTSPYARLSVDGRGIFNQDVRADFFTSTSTTLTNTFPLLAATTATTTNLALTSVTSSLLKTNSLGQVVAAVLGTDYQNFGYLFPSNATTTQLAFNGGATFAGATSTASFAVTGSTTISSALNVGSTINANGALTVAGNTSLQGATSTSFAISGISSGSILKTTTGGAIVAAVAGTDYLTSSSISAAFPFTPTTNFGATANSTSTPIWFTAGLQASSTSQFGTIGLDLLRFNATTSTSTLATFGSFALITASTTGNNTSLGLGSLANVTSGSRNTAVGSEALWSVTGGSHNTAAGYAALSANTSGADNHAFGSEALDSNTTGDRNIAMGRSALGANGSGNDNVAIGDNALLSSFGSGNVAVGTLAGWNVNNGGNHTLVGYQAGYNVTNDAYSNILIGASDVAGNLTEGSANVGLGNNLFFPSATANNQLNLGNLVFGTLPATSTAFQLPTSGSIGIGTSSPFAKFAVHANNGDTATTLFAIGSSTATATTTLFSVSNTGSTTLYQIPSSILKTTANGTIVAAVAGTDYLTSANVFSYPFPGNATTTAIAFNGGATFAGATSTASFAVTGSTTISGVLNALGGANFGTATYTGAITSTATAANVFPFASSTALTVSGTGYFGTASTTNLTISSIASGNLLKTTTGGVVGSSSRHRLRHPEPNLCSLPVHRNDQLWRRSQLHLDPDLVYRGVAG